MSSNDTEYFRGRAVIERAMAIAASQPEAAAVHDELARGYEALAREGERPVRHIVPA